MKKRKIKKKVYFVLLVIFTSILIFALFKIFGWFSDGKKINEINDEFKDIDIEERQAINGENVNPPADKTNDYWDYIKMDILSVDFKKLLAKNKDTVGWIKVNGTNINYPFVQTTDNEYYLTHAYDKSYNSAGWIFADYRNDMVNFGKHTILYGHGRLDTTMFGSLKNILKSDWYDNKDNYIVKLSTPSENTLWQVFSVYSIEAESYYLTTDFNSDIEYNNFLQTLKKRSKVSFTAEVNSKDKILTLSTCQNDYGYRVVMHAKLIKREVRE